ncbi:rhomboid-like protein 5 [Quercus suber]|uniref:RHOMBOID-like protein n=1 Tax=Quercus suber TaxID=58331 RepID=A0AAW0IN29_QUESU
MCWPRMKCKSVYLKNLGMDARVYSLASVLNLLVVMLGNCEQITFETLEAFSYIMTCEITISVGVSGALFVLLEAMVSKLFINWTIYANKCTTPLLKELVIDDLELLIKSFQRETGENWRKISHIPSIKLDWKYVQRDNEPQFDSDRFIALYANFDKDLCLIPESPFYLEGAGEEFGNKLHKDVSLYISKIKVWVLGCMMTCEIKISVGAPGAFFVPLGAMVSKIFTNWTIYANKCAALVTLVLIIAINLPLGFLPHVDNSAHIEGFLSGFPLGLDIYASGCIELFHGQKLYSCILCKYNKTTLVWMLTVTKDLGSLRLLLLAFEVGQFADFVTISFMEGFDGVWEWDLSGLVICLLQASLILSRFIALYANFDEEYLCLIPKSPFYLEGAVGISGSLFDLLEAMVSELLANWIIFAKKCSKLVTLVLIIAINCPLRFLPPWRYLANMHMDTDVLSYLMLCKYKKKYSRMVLNVNKDLGNLRLPLSAFDAGKLADCAATSFMLMAWVPKHQYYTTALYKH